MNALIWVHEDTLRDNHPVRAEAGENARAVFVWDAAYFRVQGYTAKRLVFIVECLADMSAEVFQGDTRTILAELAQGAAIYTSATTNPAFRDIIDALNITATNETPLAQLDAHADLGRFFRYWKKAGKSVMSHNGLTGGQEDLFS